MDILGLIQKLLIPDPKLRLQRYLQDNEREQTQAEPLPKYVGNAKTDRPFQIATEEGYKLVPDLIRQLLYHSGYSIRGAENLQEIDPDAASNDEATTNWEKKAILLSNNTDQNSSNIIHEIGHVFDLVPSISYSAEPAFQKAYLSEQPKQANTYADTESVEAFAELFAASLLDKKLKSQSTDYSPYGLYAKLYPKSLAVVKKLVADYIRNNTTH